MKNIDRLITALYHARSENREKMLSDLVLTVMYSSNEFMDVNAIIEFIKDFFHLEPIKYEVERCLIELVESEQIIQKSMTYCISESTQKKIHASFVKGKDTLEKRFETFNKIVQDIINETIEKEDIQKLWDIFNEYLLECFMIFGKKAIDMFLPYRKDEMLQNNLILEEAYKNLKSEKLVSIFKKLIIEYPERLTEAELRHLNGLATRAERFYSLGIEKNEYEKISNLQIKNLIVIADTNILYTILNLHIHQEKSAIMEIVRLAKQKIIDFRIVYLPKTYKELQNAKIPLENAISREKFSYSQIKALLACGSLDSLAKEYYENKLNNKDYPHPADNITYAKDILEQYGISIYNYKFQKLEENKEYFNKKVTEYYDYQHYYNNLSTEKGLVFHLNKEDYKIEHDIFLREVVKILKEKYSKEILKFFSLTIDRSLVQFDHFILEKESGGLSIINPNFIIPSMFLKKIRPFIPIITNNYRKAFIASLTAPAFHWESEEEKEKTILTQKSLMYFKNLGIEDEEVICEIIKRELFLEEFSKHEQTKTAEDFIKSEIARELEQIKSRNATLEKEITTQKETFEKILEKEKQDSGKLKTEKEKTEKKKLSEIGKLLQKIKEQESLKDQIKRLKEQQAKFSNERTIELKGVILEEVTQSIITLENTEKPLHNIIERKFRNYLWRLSIIPISYFFIIGFLIYKLTWNIMEPYTYLLSIFGVICSYLYFAITGKSFSPAEYFNTKKVQITEKVYSEFNFNNAYLNLQRQRKTELESEINELSMNTISPATK